MRIIDTLCYELLDQHGEEMVEIMKFPPLTDEDLRDLDGLAERLGESPEAWRGWWLALDLMYFAVKDEVDRQNALAGIVCPHTRQQARDTLLTLWSVFNYRAFQIVVEREKALAAARGN
jgi:hypothetical protein